MKDNTILSRVERHVIKNTNCYFLMLLDFCKQSKNLYNHANYIVRQEFINNKKWIRYNELNNILKNDSEFPDYYNIPTVQAAQQTLRLLDKNWKSFFQSIKDWKKNPNKYLGMPKQPGYKNKNGYFELILTNQNCRLKNGVVYFPKRFNNFCIPTNIDKNKGFRSFQHVRLIPHSKRITIEIVYTISKQKSLENNGRYIGIDIGVDNLATVANTCNIKSFIINGKPIKSINQFYNKKLSHYKSICERMNSTKTTNRIKSITMKRNEKINDYLHKASKYIIEFCSKNNINTIIIGKNNEWKQNSNMSKRVNQNFVQIPFARFINMIQYKAENVGITVILTEESYTSGTSFLDDELPCKEYYRKSRRIHRGLFKSNNNTYINADLNGAYQIIKKVVPIKWDRGCALHPFVVNMV